MSSFQTKTAEITGYTVLHICQEAIFNKNQNTFLTGLIIQPQWNLSLQGSLLTTTC